MKLAYARCTCGHENRLHASHGVIDPQGYECQMVCCDCRIFKLAEGAPSTITSDDRARARDARRPGWSKKMPKRGRADK